MLNIDIHEACDTINRYAVTIGGTYHGGAWLHDQLMRVFEDGITEAVTISCELSYGATVRETEATIHRDGRLELNPV